MAVAKKKAVKKVTEEKQVKKAPISGGKFGGEVGTKKFGEVIKERYAGGKE